MYYVCDDKLEEDYSLTESLNKCGQVCQVNFETLQEYLKSRYSKFDKKNNVEFGWNYLKVNNKVVYDFMSDIKNDLASVNDNDFLYYIYRTNYIPISIINNRYVCYFNQDYYFAIGAAHPLKGSSFACVNIINHKKFMLNQIFNEKEIVTKAIQNPELINNISRNNSSNIVSYKELNDEFAKSTKDDLMCIENSIESNSTSFIIDKLNSDGTVDISLGLSGQSTPCDNIFKVLKLKALRTKIKINSLTKSKDFS